MKYLAAGVLALLVCGSIGRAQVVSVAATTATYSNGGGTVTLNVTLNWAGDMSALGFQITGVPAGWSYASTSGLKPPAIVPAAGATQRFEFAYVTIPAPPAVFSIQLSYPAGLQGEQRLTAITGVFRASGAASERLVSAADIVFNSDGAQPAVAPAITTQPAGATLNAGQSTLLTVAATGSGPIAYQWRKDGNAIAGATDASLSLTNVTAAAAGSYSVAVSNAAGSVTSAAAVVSVIVAPTSAAPQIATPPANVSVAVGGAAGFTVVASGTAPLAYQWSREGVPIPGATNASLALTNIAASAAGLYAVTVSNSAGSASASATLGVTTIAAPVITAQPQSATVQAGTSAILAVTASGAGPLTYLWTKDGTAVAGGTDATLTLTNVQAASAGSYAVVVSNSGGSVASAKVTLTVSATPVPPQIISQPVELNITVGAAANFTVIASGTAPLSYQWRRNGEAISGATAATLTLANAQVNQSGDYSVIVSDSAGSTTSAPARLTVTEITGPASRSGVWLGALEAGGPLALFLRADGTGVLLAFQRATRIGFVARDLVVDAAGRFSGRALASNGSSIDVQGILTAGKISGSLGSLAFSITTGAAGGPAAPPAGFYQAGAAGRSATAWAIVDGAGGVYLETLDGTSADAGRGALGAGGVFDLTTEGGARLSGEVQAATGVIAFKATAGDGSALNFAGANNDARQDIEKLVNISTRSQAGGASGALIAGFVITGEQPKLVLVRAVGPTLASFGVSGVLTAAHLEVFRDSTALAAGGDWGAGADAAAIASAGARLGAFALPDNSRDAALLLRLAPGTYSAVVTGPGGAAGNTLVEVYDATEGAIPRSQRIINISTRAAVGVGGSALISGFVIRGDVPKRVLVRGAGPALAAFGLTGTLAAPQITVFSGDAIVAQNAGWSSSADAAAIGAASGSVGAFAFPQGSADAALVVHLQPGAYTAQLSGVGGTAGVALLEIYELP